LEVAQESVLEMLFVGLLAAFEVGLAELEEAIDHAGELVRCSRVGLGGAEAREQGQREQGQTDYLCYRRMAVSASPRR
jgi:hypothetical protein